MSKTGDLVIDQMNEENQQCLTCVHKITKGVKVCKGETQSNNFCRMKNINVNNVAPSEFGCNTYIKKKENLCKTCVNNQLSQHGSGRGQYCLVHGHEIKEGITECKDYQ